MLTPTPFWKTTLAASLVLVIGCGPKPDSTEADPSTGGAPSPSEST
jgi:hypothetical protein